jgi:cytochrome c-type biogenesis protein CcmH/NrfG
LARFPKDLDGRLELGDFFLENNHPDIAEKFFRSALAVDPACAEALAGLARVQALSPSTRE